MLSLTIYTREHKKKLFHSHFHWHWDSFILVCNLTVTPLSLSFFILSIHFRLNYVFFSFIRNSKRRTALSTNVFVEVKFLKQSYVRQANSFHLKVVWHWPNVYFHSIVRQPNLFRIKEFPDNAKFPNCHFHRILNRELSKSEFLSFALKMLSFQSNFERGTQFFQWWCTSDLNNNKKKCKK